MVGYLIRRVIGMFILLFLLSVTVFVLFSLLPGDPARLTCGKACSPAVVESNRRRLGLDEPVIVQYEKFVSGLFVGRIYSPSSPEPIVCEAPCLGYSFVRRETVGALLARTAPVTFWLAIGAFVIWMAIGLFFGIIAALNRGNVLDRLITGISLIGYSMPSFFFGLILVFFVIIKLQWLPFPSFIEPWEDPVRFVQTMILPWITLAILDAAFYIRLTRNQVLETFGEDYVRTARAKGLPEGTVVVRHALRAGLSPIVTSAGLDLAGLLGGAIISENIFSLPGLGSLAVDSVLQADLPVINGLTLVTAAIIIVANLVVDLLYAVIDPRVRIG
ncbi:MAG TPA: ABC transporter permease [Candidatus Limnocylindria bacterium]|nr:ABC transporter permease [Candidatus Limnocylindria bacterium]